MYVININSYSNENYASIGNTFLPERRYARLEFLQGILEDKFLSFTNSEVNDVPIHKSWEEYAVKNVWPLVKHCTLIRPYLPVALLDKDKFCDRHFFWGILFTCIPKWSEAYHR